MNVRSPLTLPALAALALLCVSPLHAVTLEDDLLHWWLMGEQASATGGNPGGDVVSILAHDGHGPDLLIQGTLDEQPGNPFDPYPFQDNLANNHTNGSHFLVGAEASLDLSGDFTYSLWARQTGGGRRQRTGGGRPRPAQRLRPRQRSRWRAVQIYADQPLHAGPHPARPPLRRL